MATRSSTINNVSTTYTGDVTIQGDLNVSGDTTTVSVHDLTVEDATITLFSGNTGDSVTADGSGIVVDAGTDTDKSFLYDNSVEQFVSSIPLGAPAGDSSNPSISFSGDPDTGLYRPAANTVAVVAGTVEGLRVTSSTVSMSVGRVEYSDDMVDGTYRGNLPAATVDQYVMAQVAFGVSGLYRVLVWATALDTTDLTVYNAHFDLQVVYVEDTSVTITYLLKNHDDQWAYQQLSDGGTDFDLAITLDSHAADAQDFNIHVQVMPITGALTLDDVTITYPLTDANP